MNNTPDGQPLEPVFDWYQFTAKVSVNDVREILAPMAQDEPMRPENPKLKGYLGAAKLGGRGGSVLVHFGGKNGDEFGPNIAGTGPLAPTVAELFRAASVPHGVGRADVRVDFLGDFDQCRLAFIERCNAAGMGASDHGSCPESAKQLGRTVYGGSRTSVYQPTCYEKGIQLGEGLPRDYLRLEHRFAFTKAHEKTQLSGLSPAQMIGLRPVARDLTAALSRLAVQPYKLTKFPKERTPYHWMLTQYGGVLREMHMDQGSWACVGEQIGLDLGLMEDAH